MSIASSCCVVPTLLPNGITVFALKCLEERRVKSRRVGEQRRNHRQTRMLLKIIPKPLRRQNQKNKSLRCRSERFNAFCYYEPRRNHWPYFSFLTDARQTAQDYNSLRKKCISGISGSRFHRRKEAHIPSFLLATSRTESKKCSPHFQFRRYTSLSACLPSPFYFRSLTYFLEHRFDALPFRL